MLLSTNKSGTFQAESKRVDTKKKTPSGPVFKSSDHSAFSSSSSSFNSSLNDVADTTSKHLETVLDELKYLGNDVQLLLDRQQQFSDKQVDVLDTKFDKHYSSIQSELNTSITSGISKSQSDLSALCAGIEQLKNFVESTYHRSGTLSESIESLVASVTKHGEDLVDLTAAFKATAKAQKTSNLEQKEELMCVKRVSTESKMLLDEIRTSYEKDSLLLRQEEQDLLVEKEKFAKEKALFEQRKLAAKDEIEYADAMMKTVKEAEQKVSEDCKRLVQLSEFVVSKNKEADEKLAEALRLSTQLEEWQGAIANDNEAVQKLKQRLEDDLMMLSRDRVSLMKNKAGMHVVTSNPLGRSTKVNLMSDFSLAQPGELRRRLVSVKAEMKRLSNDA